MTKDIRDVNQGYRSRASTISELLRDLAERTPDAPAILAPGRSVLDFRGLLGQLEATIEALAGCGVGRGDRVALALDEGPELAVVLLAAPSVAAAAPFDPASTAAEFEAVFSRLAPSVVLVSGGAPTAARGVAAKLGIPVIDLVPGNEAAGIFALVHEVGPNVRPIDMVGPEDVAFLFSTSGTTARPRLAPLTQANVLASAFGVRDALELTASDRCLNLMRMYHISFLSNLIPSLAAGANIVCPPSFRAPQLFTWLEEFRPTWYMASPAFHRAVLDRASTHADVIARRPLRFIRSGSAPLSPAEEARLEATFGSPVILAYGITEASPSVTSMPMSPGIRKPGSVGISTGPEIEIRGERGEPLPRGVVGEIVIRGRNVIRGYVDDPLADAEAFTADGWCRTGDLGWLDDNHFLFLAGRLKEVINRGGQKIAPQQVDSALLDHPAVLDAAAFAVPDDQLGEVVGAVVVLRAGHAATPQELREFIAERLAYHKVPQQIVFLDALPTGPTGKPRRVGLAHTLGLVPAPLAEPTSEAGFVAPRTPLEELVAGIWAELLAQERVGVDDDFLALGGDSILAAQVATRLRASLGLAIPLATFFDTPTVAALSRAISELSTGHVGERDLIGVVTETDALLR